MATARTEADSNMIATLNWEIPFASFKSIYESNSSRGQTEIKGLLRCKEFIWYLYLVNDGLIQLTLDCATTTEYCFPTLYYDLRFGGTILEPYLSRAGPIFSLIKGPRQLYSYGTLNLLTVPVVAFQRDLRHFMPNNQLHISLKLSTFIEVNGESDVREVKLSFNPPNKALMKDLNQLLKEPKFSDVTINCLGGALKAHRCILAARSTFFSDIFKSAVPTANEVTIEDVDISVMKLVLQFIYTGETNLADVNMMEMLRCAEKFDLIELRTDCFNKIRAEDTENENNIFLGLNLPPYYQ